MHFVNRRAAGRLLARELKKFAGEDVVVLALPRGGVPVAYEIAVALCAPLDVLVVRKLGVPWQPELAMGALASGEVVVENPDVLRMLPDPQQALDAARAREAPELARRERLYRGNAPRPEVQGRCAIVVDDGMATGATMAAAVRALKQRGASRIVIAIPVGSREAIERLRGEVDEVICLSAPELFYAVGSWYDDFTQTEDEEVASLMQQAAAFTAQR